MMSTSLSRILGLAAASAAALPALTPVGAIAQTTTNLAALHGLAPVSVLLNTPEGKAALAANLTVTGAIQTGALEQPILLPFPEQQQLALRDAFITDRNATELADGLGTTLGRIYQAIAHYDDPTHATQLSKPVADFIAYTNRTTAADSNSGKYFFANATTDGKTPVSGAATAIFAANGGVTDVFGRAYGRVAGSAGASVRTGGTFSRGVGRAAAFGRSGLGRSDRSGLGRGRGGFADGYGAFGYGASGYYGYGSGYGYGGYVGPLPGAGYLDGPYGPLIVPGYGGIPEAPVQPPAIYVIDKPSTSRPSVPRRRARAGNSTTASLDQPERAGPRVIEVPQVRR